MTAVLKNGSHELQSSQSASAAPAASAALRWGVPPWVRNYKRLWNDTFRLGKICFMCVFHPFSCLHTFLIVLGISEVSCFMIHFLYNDGWVQFSSMQELQVPHLHEQADLGFFFLKQSSEDCWFFCRFPENWATGFPVKYWDFQRFRWFPSDSDELRGSEKIFRSEVLTISKLRNSDIFRWFHGQKNRPQKKGPDVMDSRDLNQPGNGNQKN